jgi:hypothetical protein
VLRQEDTKEGGDQVIHALDIPTGRVPVNIKGEQKERRSGTVLVLLSKHCGNARQCKQRGLHT